MKKTLLLALLTAAALPALADAPAGMITAMPQGTLYGNCYTYTEYTSIPSAGGLGRTQTDGIRADIIVNEDDNTVFIHNIICDYPGIDSWVKGDLASDGTVTFSFPQPVFYRPAGGNLPELTLYATMTTPKTVDGTITIVPDTEHPDLIMKWDGKSLTQVKPGTAPADLERFDGLVALLNQDNAFSSYSESGISYTVWPDDPVTLPAADLLEDTPYTCTYTDQWNDPFATRVTIYREKGTDNCYITGLNYLEPSQAVRATVDDKGRLTLPSAQFMGYTEGCFTFFYGATYGRDDKNYPVYTWLDAATLTADGENLTADTDIIINLGNRKPTLGLGINGLCLTSIDALVLTPVAPEIEHSETELIFEDDLGMFILCFTQQPLSTEGHALETDKLFYTVYVNGEPYTFDPDMALGTLPGPMTEVPWDFNNGEDLGSLPDGYHVALGMTFEEIKSLGVQSIYKNRDAITKTDIVYWQDPAGVSDITTAAPVVVSSQYFDLSGRAIDEPRGLCIRRDIHADGTASATKIFVK